MVGIIERYKEDLRLAEDARKVARAQRRMADEYPDDSKGLIHDAEKNERIAARFMELAREAEKIK